MTRVRSLLVATGSAGLLLSGFAAPALCQGPIVDEGAFRISRPSSSGPEVENFRISRGAGGQLIATGNLIAGPHRVSSTLVADSAGVPVRYGLKVMDNGKTGAEVRAAVAGGRLRTMSTNQRGDETDRDYPVGRERTVILDDDLVHQLYFSGLATRSGTIRVISPHAASAANYTMSAHGLEPIDVGSQSVTATHLSLENGADRRDFWVDSEGRVLRVETSAGLKAVRDELPRKR